MNRVFLLMIISFVGITEKVYSQSIIGVDSYTLDTVNYKVRLDLKLDDLQNFTKLMIKVGNVPNSSSSYHLNCPITFDRGDFYVNAGPDRFAIIKKQVSLILSFTAHQYSNANYITVIGIGASSQTSPYSILVD